MEPQPNEWKKAAAEVKKALEEKGILPVEEKPTQATPPAAPRDAQLSDKASEVVVEVKCPIWPVDLDVWKKNMAEIEARQAVKPDDVLSPERKEEIARWARQAAQRWWDSRPKSRVVEKKEEETVAKTKAPKEGGRQKRLGQTKLIDDLLRAGKSEAEITEAIKTQIPSYPVERIPKMIKLRQYHVKKNK